MTSSEVSLDSRILRSRILKAYTEFLANEWRGFVKSPSGIWIELYITIGRNREEAESQLSLYGFEVVPKRS